MGRRPRVADAGALLHRRPVVHHVAARRAVVPVVGIVGALIADAAQCPRRRPVDTLVGITTEGQDGLLGDLVDGPFVGACESARDLSLEAILPAIDLLLSNSMPMPNCVMRAENGHRLREKRAVAEARPTVEIWFNRVLAIPS